MRSFILAIYSDYEFLEKQTFKKALQERFPFIHQFSFHLMQLPRSCWDNRRHQYNANCVLNWRQNQPNDYLFLILTKYNLYSPGLRFVFGIGHHRQGAVTSSYYLNNDINFLIKEVTHEFGHVLGLSHCSLPCVMTFSNSVLEARQKNDVYCATCTIKLHKNINNWK
jgi:archaemetzincin